MDKPHPISTSLRLLGRGVATLIERRDWIVSLAAVALTVLAVLNQHLAAAVSHWHGLSRWLALVPIGALFLYGLLRAHYKGLSVAYEELTDRHHDIGSLEARVRELEEAPVPVLAFDDVKVDSQVFMPAQKAYAIFLFGRVFNKQSAPARGATAQRAIPRWECYDLSGTLLYGPCDGRWRDAADLANATRFKLHTHDAAIDLEANEVRHELDLAFKFPLEECFYLVDHEQQAYRLEQTVRLKVAIHGNNFKPIKAEYQIGYARGEGGGLSVSREA